jgi:hypothetical protein
LTEEKAPGIETRVVSDVRGILRRGGGSVYSGDTIQTSDRLEIMPMMTLIWAADFRASMRVREVVFAAANHCPIIAGSDH